MWSRPHRRQAAFTTPQITLGVNACWPIRPALLIARNTGPESTPADPRGTPEKRPMRDTSKPANRKRQDKVVITHSRTSRQRNTSRNASTIGYADETWA